MDASRSVLRARWAVRRFGWSTLLAYVVLFTGIWLWWLLMGEDMLPVLVLPLGIEVRDIVRRIRRRGHREPVLEIDDEGVLDTRLRIGRIRWHDIEEVRRCQQQVWIGLRQGARVDDPSRLRESIWTRPLTARSRRGVLVTATDLDVSRDQIEAAIRMRAPDDGARACRDRARGERLHS